MATNIGSNPVTSFLMQKRLAIFFISLILLLGLSWGMGKIQYATDYRIFFPPSDPAVLQLDEVHDQFWKSDTLLFVIKDPKGDIFTKKNLTAVADLTKDSWQVPYSYRVDSLANYQHIYGENDNIYVIDLFRTTANFDTEDLEKIKKIGLNEVDLVNQLVSPDGSTLGVLITLQFPSDTLTAAYEATIAAREMVKSFKDKNPSLQIELTGLAVVETSYLEVTQQDMSTITPAMYAVILLMTAIVFRGVGAVLVVLTIITLSTTSTMGLSGWLGVEATALTGLLPTIVLVIAVADIIHIMAVLRNLNPEIESRLERTKQAVSKTIKPIAATTLTTTIGFSSLAFAASPPYQDFGIMAAIASILAFVTTIVMAPVLLPLIKLKPGKGLTDWQVESVMSGVLRRPYLWFSVFFALVLIMTWSASNNVINDRIVENFDETVPVRTATEFAFDNLVGIYRLEYIAEAIDKDITNPGFLAEMDKFASWLRKQPEVSSVNILTDSIKKLNRAMNNGSEAMYKLPTDHDASAQMLLLYEMSLPFGMDLSNQINILKSASRIVVTLTRLDTVQIRAFKEKADTWWKNNSDPGYLTPSVGTGETVVFANLTHISIEYMVYGVAFALLLITALISVFLRSLTLGLLSFVPNVLPFIILFGIWAFISAEINTAAANVCVIVYGLFVDATIHLMHEYKLQRVYENLEPREAIASAYKYVLPAITLNTIILSSGFLVLMLSPFTMNADFGLLGAIGVLCAYAIDLWLLPIILLCFDSLVYRKSKTFP